MMKGFFFHPIVCVVGFKKEKSYHIVPFENLLCMISNKMTASLFAESVKDSMNNKDNLLYVSMYIGDPAFIEV